MNIKSSLLETGLFIDNEYLDKYVELIVSNKNTPKISNVTFSHHIIPVYVYKLLCQPVDNTRLNRVNLSYTNHMLAHFYLAKCASTNEGFYANACALFYIFPKLPTQDSELIEKMIPIEEIEVKRRRLQSERSSGRIVLPSTRQKISEANKLKFGNDTYKYVKKGDVVTKVPSSKFQQFIDEGWEPGTNRNYTAWNKGITASDEMRKRFSEAKKGRVWITHPTKGDKLTSKEEATLLESQGWIRGRGAAARRAISLGSYGKAPTCVAHTKETKRKIGLSNSGGVYVNKDGVLKHISTDELTEYISSGWHKGGLHTTRGKYCWVSNGEHTLLIRIEQLETYIASGYHKGRK